MRDPQTTSRITAAVKSKNTRPEVALRKALFRRGLRYRLHARVVGRPDIVFPGPKVAVFVDGDFWHGNAWRIRGMSSFDEQFLRMNNPDFWRNKIRANMERDKKVNAALAAEGWSVYRVFESDLKRDIDRIAEEIMKLVRKTDEVRDTARR